MKLRHLLYFAVMFWVFGLVPVRAAVDSAICTTADAGATCSGTEVITSTNEEITAARALGTLPLTVTSGTNNIVATTTPSITSYVNGQHFWLKPNAANTSTVLLNISGLGLKPLTDAAGSPLSAGALQTATGYEVVYYASNDQFQLAATGPTASTPILGVQNPLPTPPTGTVTLGAISVGGRLMPSYRGAGNYDVELQPFLGMERVSLISPAPNAALVTSIGINPTATGTLTAATIATTNLHNSMRRVDYLQTVAAATNVAGWRSAGNSVFMGNATIPGGFHLVTRWGQATGAVFINTHCFVGLAAAAGALTDIDPSSQTNFIGMGWDAADANLQIMSAGAGAATKVNLGAAFAEPTVDRVQVYQLEMFAAPGATTVSWKASELSSGASATGTISAANLPATLTLMSPRGWCSVGGSATVVGFSLMNFYLESNQ
jgi:hypothetical protein